MGTMVLDWDCYAPCTWVQCVWTCRLDSLNGSYKTKEVYCTKTCDTSSISTCNVMIGPWQIQWVEFVNSVLQICHGYSRFQLVL